MKNTILSILLLQCIGLNFAQGQGLFMLGAGTASSPTPLAAAPITTVGITNTGSFTQTGTSTFNGSTTQNGNLSLSSGNITVSSGNLTLSSPTSTADLKGNVKVGKDLTVEGNTTLKGKTCFQGPSNIFEKPVAIGITCGTDPLPT
jgi:hypothetical protein